MNEPKQTDRDDPARLIADGMYAVFDGMTWPAPGEGLADLEWRLRYGDPNLSDRLVAASVVTAYMELVCCPRATREVVVRQIRKSVEALQCPAK